MTHTTLCPRCGAQYSTTCPATHAPRRGSILKTVAIVVGVLFCMMLAFGFLGVFVLFRGHAEPQIASSAPSPPAILRPADQHRADIEILSRTLDAEVPDAPRASGYSR